MQERLEQAKIYYPLSVKDGCMGTGNERGTLTLRLLYSSRGSVLRGLDEGICRMSLGEKAVITMRHDYAFGEVCVECIQLLSD